MSIEEQRKILTRLGVDVQEEVFIKSNSRGKKHLIVCRTGIDKMEKNLKIGFKFISVTESSYKDGSNVSVVMEGVTNSGFNVQALGSANPDTTDFKFYSDTAARRAKHKLVLKIAELYQHDVHSEDESEDFKRPKKKDFTPAVDEALSKIK
jgi:hypothetical protein